MLKKTAAFGVGLLVVAALAAGCRMTPEFEDKYQEGKWLQEEQRYEEAISAFDAYRDRHPESVLIPLLVLRQGECYEAIGQYDMAKQAYEEAAALSDDVAPFAKENLEALKERMEREEREAEEALEALEEAEYEQEDEEDEENEED